MKGLKEFRVVFTMKEFVSQHTPKKVFTTTGLTKSIYLSKFQN